MQDDQLPVGPLGEEAPLPARRDAALSSFNRAGPLSVEMLEERKDDSDKIDLISYWRTLVKRRWLILGVLATAVALSLLLTLMATPMYRATAVMQIDNEEQNIVQMGVVSTAGTDPGFLNTQVQLLKSYSLAERVADELALDEAAMQRLDGSGWLNRIIGLVRPAPAPAAGGVEEAPRLTSVTAVVRGGLSVEPVPNSRLVRISYDSPIPEFSARVANAVADSFIALGLERRFGASSYAKTYLEDQLATTKARLEDSERQLVAFAQKENLVTSTEGQSLAGQNLGALNSALAAAQGERIRTQARWNSAQRASGPATLPSEMLGASPIPGLLQQRAALQGTYQQKLQVLQEDFPAMQQIKGQMVELDRQIAAAFSDVRATVKAEYDMATAQERLLVGQLGSLRSQVLDVDGRSIDYNIIKREVDTNRQLYDGLLQRYKEVGVAGDVRSNNISVVDRARVPGGPFTPRVIRNLSLGLLLGLLLGVLVAFVLEFLDDTLKTPDDVEQRLKLAVLGIIPKLLKQTPEDAVKDPRSAFSESYRSVRTALQFSTDHGVPKVLLITSASPTEGKSTTALTLARNFAQLGKQVLLVEADMRNPSLHKSLGLRSEIGLSNVLSGSNTMLEALLDTDRDGLKVVLAGPLPPNPAELLSGSRLVSFLTIAASHYDQVIIDGPPVMGIADAPILAHIADGTLIVVDSGSTRISTALAAVKRLKTARAHIVGSVLTKYDAKVAGYGYNYEGYYAYGGAPQLTKR